MWFVLVKQGKEESIEYYTTFKKAAAYFMRRENFLYEIYDTEGIFDNAPSPEAPKKEPIEIAMGKVGGKIYMYLCIDF